MVENTARTPSNPEVTAPISQEGTSVRTFASGATRNLDDNKLDYEGFLSPLVLEVFARYMNSHRRQADGKLRDSDNWQKGMGKSVYMKSLWRHFMDLWHLHRGHQPVSPETGEPVSIETAISACLFNLQGYLHEHLQPEKYAATQGHVPEYPQWYTSCDRTEYAYVKRLSSNDTIFVRHDGSFVSGPWCLEHLRTRITEAEAIALTKPSKDSPDAPKTTEATIAEQTAQCVRETFEAVNRMFPVPEESPAKATEARNWTCRNCHQEVSNVCGSCIFCGVRRSHPAKKKNTSPVVTTVETRNGSDYCSTCGLKVFVDPNKGRHVCPTCEHG